MFNENRSYHSNSAFSYGNKTKAPYRIDADMEGKVTYFDRWSFIME